MYGRYINRHRIRQCRAPSHTHGLESEGFVHCGDCASECSVRFFSSAAINVTEQLAGRECVSTHRVGGDIIWTGDHVIRCYIKYCNQFSFQDEHSKCDIIRHIWIVSTEPLLSYIRTGDHFNISEGFSVRLFNSFLSKGR